MMMWACARLPVDRSRAISAHPLFLLRWAPSPPPTHHPNAQPQAAHRTEQNMSNGENVKTEGGAAGDHIVIRVRDQTGEEVQFKVKPTTKMQKIFAAFAARKGVQEQSLRFFLDGERIQGDATPESLGLESEDQIDVMLEQQGGAAF